MHPREEVGAIVKTESKSLGERGREIYGWKKGALRRERAVSARELASQWPWRGVSGEYRYGIRIQCHRGQGNRYHESRKESNKFKPQMVDVQHLLKRSNNLVRITTSARLRKVRGYSLIPNRCFSSGSGLRSTSGSSHGSTCGPFRSGRLPVLSSSGPLGVRVPIRSTSVGSLLFQSIGVLATFRFQWRRVPVPFPLCGVP
jgi:hypothetical protein